MVDRLVVLRGMAGKGHDQLRLRQGSMQFVSRDSGGDDVVASLHDDRGEVSDALEIPLVQQIAVVRQEEVQEREGILHPRHG